MSTPAKALDVEDTIVIEANSILPLAQPSMQIVEVIAPATLEAGYTFEAVCNNEVITVTVPLGGVKAGQRMELPYEPRQQQQPAELIVYGDAYIVPEAMPVLTPALPMNQAQASSYYYYNPPTDTTPLVIKPSSSSSLPPTMGYWKDGLFDCCKYGCCHLSYLCSCCFPRIMIAQILTRMKLTICGNYTNDESWKKTYIRMWIIVIAYYVFQWFFGCPTIQHVYFDVYGLGNYPMNHNDYANSNNNNNNNNQDTIGKVIGWYYRLRYGNHRNHNHNHNNNNDSSTNYSTINPTNGNPIYFDYDPHCPDEIRTINLIISIMMGIYSLYILTRLRMAVRKKYNIPTGQTCSTATCCCCCCFYACHPLEDFCCSFCFPCCTVAQLARQTGNYEDNPAVCCSNTGLLKPIGTTLDV